MKVAWLTPLSTRSAIAEYSLTVGGGLASRCDLVLWAADMPPWRETTLRITDAGKELSDGGLGDYDHIVYNLGDHPAFHGLILRASKRWPGVCVLHDRTYENLLQGHARAATSSMRDVIAGARGVIVHAADHARAVESEWLGPVARVQFPAYPRFLSTPPPARPAQGDRRLAVTAGYVNPNKQIHRVIDAIAADPHLRSKLEYRVVGPAEDTAYARQLGATVKRCGLDDCVTLILGYQPDEEFARHLRDADAFVNLREPPLESASASLFEEMSHGKPIVVSDVGYFSEVPDDTVLKVAAGDDEGLRRHLRRIVDDEGLVRTVGGSARRYLTTLPVDQTVDAVVRFLEETRDWRPLLDLTDRVAVELAQFGASPDSPIVGDVAKQIAPMLRARAESSVQLRPLRAADCDELAELFLRNAVPEVARHFHPFALDRTSARTLTSYRGRDRYYVAEREGKLIALSMLRGWDEGYDVPSFGIVVDRGSTGQGVGGKLTDYTLDEAKRLGSASVRLSVYASNDVGYRLYRDRGFIEQSRENVEAPLGDDVRIVMLKSLT